MRLPVRSESEAFRVMLAVVAAIAISVLIGWLTELLVGVLVFAFAVVLAVAVYLLADNPDRRTGMRDAAREFHPHGAVGGKRHVVVVANETLAGDQLRRRIIGADAERVEVDVLAPLLVSHLHRGVSDIDGELADARARLARSLAWAQDCGIVARGEVGGPSATTAIEDRLRDFGADEVIVVTRSRERATWRARGELRRLRRELNVPVTHIMVGRRHGPTKL